ncbi:hypothetical protein VK92_15345 [Burkholderia sp. LK4]|nr:hypothetical protein VL00_05715 [Burkholderia cepacia]KMN59554.1 hypothetical protein VK92_15345 [Burkholderia sp. LK4]
MRTHMSAFQGGDMKLKQAIDRIPGSIVLAPMLLGTCVHTFAPNAGKYFGSFTNALMTSTVPILAVWFFCMGATIDLRATGIVIVVTGVLLMLVDRFIDGGNGAARLAASSTAGAAVANPTHIAEMNPRFKPMAAPATAMVAASCLLTALYRS